MNTAYHDVQMLGAYVLGTLEPAEVATVEAHVATCPACREELEGLRAMKDSLGELPPEALLDGPPEDADLVLQRTLRRVRAERAATRTRRGLLAAGAAAVACVVLFGGGVVIGRALAPDTPETTEPPQVAGQSVLASEEDPLTGARATVMLQPEDQGVRVDAVVTGIPEGEECQLVVVTEDGTSEIATSWTVSPEAAAEGSEPGGSAPVDPDTIDSVVVRNSEDTTFVTVPL